MSWQLENDNGHVFATILCQLTEHQNAPVLVYLERKLTTRNMEAKNKRGKFPSLYALIWKFCGWQQGPNVHISHLIALLSAIFIEKCGDWDKRISDILFYCKLQARANGKFKVMQPVSRRCPADCLLQFSWVTAQEVRLQPRMKIKVRGRHYDNV